MPFRDVLVAAGAPVDLGGLVGLHALDVDGHPVGVGLAADPGFGVHHPNTAQRTNSNSTRSAPPTIA